MSGPVPRIADSLAVALIRTLLGAIALLIALVGLGVLTWGGYVALTLVVHPAWAAVLTGVGLLLVAALICLVALSLGGSRRRTGASSDPAAAHGSARGTRAPGGGASGTLSREMALAAGETTMDAIRRNPKSASLAALAAGLVLGLSPELRRAVRDALG
ncbi:hypothetical protein F1188_07745 [Roseospira marina]|uniref:Uncharacterized protein n=1 Tax=Roseospira marina TaxID=140057 RepID=A0A5M6IDF0_9PROT|nr:hypothetical protein [Roseospira marina]KAA5606301.1 hypothetical protein F1188_07745 [Roseospira marina]MBB4314462.1 hypothetical protein [Roseospira marina]MBB5087622.1 hypothetical protein [Roseospira marina]